MTTKETVKVLELLNAFYAGGKNDPNQQVVAWHLILKNYRFEDAMNAVLRFAENDTRDYATFPAVGKIVQAIRAQQIRQASAVKGVIWGVSYGKCYEELKDESKSIISESKYNEWLAMDAEEFAYNSEKYAEQLRGQVLAIEEARRKDDGRM